MARRNWGHSWHSLCSYQGKLKPSIAQCLVKAVLPSSGGGRLLDIFSGVGTIPFEARLLGHTAFGFDINPAAVAISRAKLEPVDWSSVDAILIDLENEIVRTTKDSFNVGADLDGIRFNGPIESYFHEDTLKEILVARRFFKRRGVHTGADALVFSCLLHILHGNRPYALSRRSHPITPFAPSGPFEYRGLIGRLRKKVDKARQSADDIPSLAGRAFLQDVTHTWPSDVGELDAIVTSPPFFDSTRFYSANWMRLWFCGWDSGDFATKPIEFIDERQKVSFCVYESIFQQAQQRLKRGGYFIAHVGKSRKCDMAAELQIVGSRYLRLEDWFAESVGHCESHGIRDKGTVTHHQYLLFRNDL